METVESRCNIKVRLINNCNNTNIAASIRLTVDGGTDQWLSWLKLNKYESCEGAEPDLITGDMDSVSTEAVNYFNNKSNNVSVRITPDQDETDFTKSLRVIQCHAVSKSIQVIFL